MFVAASLTVARRWKRPKCALTDEWRSKMWSMRTMGHHPDLKGQELLAQVVIWTDPEDMTLSERSQSQKDMYGVIPLTRET